MLKAARAPPHPTPPSAPPSTRLCIPSDKILAQTRRGWAKSVWGDRAVTGELQASTCVQEEKRDFTSGGLGCLPGWGCQGTVRRQGWERCPPLLEQAQPSSPHEVRLGGGTALCRVTGPVFSHVCIPFRNPEKAEHDPGPGRGAGLAPLDGALFAPSPGRES